MTPTTSLDQLNTEQLRSLAAQLLPNIERLDKEVLHHKTRNQQLIHEIAQLKRHRFAKRAESFSPDQASLLDNLIDTGIGAIEAELEILAPKSASTPAHQKPKGTSLPTEFPRTLIHHELENTQCTCGCALKRIDEDVSEKLDYTPGVFSVERHVRGKWVCNDCETLFQAPVPAQVIDKGIPTAGLLAQVMIAKYAEYLPLYRQEKIFGRAGLAIPRSTLAQWIGTCGVQLQPLVDALRKVVLKYDVVHVDEISVQMLAPGSKKTHRAYFWAYATISAADLQAVVYVFSPGRSGKYARNFLGAWKGKLVCDDYGSYKASVALGVTEIGCMAHARRKFYELHVTKKSILAEQTLQYIAAIYEVEREVRGLEPKERRRIRQEKAAPLMEALHPWMIAQRELVFEGLIITKALDYSLKRWTALSRYLNDGALPINNNHIEQQIRPWALVRKNWLFAGSLRSGKRAAALMSLIQSAKLNGHDPNAYLKGRVFSLACPRSGQVKSESCCHIVGNRLSCVRWDTRYLYVNN